MSSVIVFDFDGVLANIDHRLDHVRDGKNDYDAFFSFESTAKDTPIEPMIELLWSMWYANEKSVELEIARPLILTARPEKTREDTIRWFLSYGFEGLSDNQWIFRPDNDWKIQSAAKWKVSELKKLRESYDIMGFFDDHPGNVQAAVEIGIPSILVSLNGEPRK